MEEKKPPVKKHNRKKYIVIIAVAVVVVGWLLLRRALNKPTLNTVGKKPAVSQPVIVKSFKLGSLSFESDQEVVPVSQNVGLKLKASSEGKNIVGYDIILKYDTDAFELSTKESLLPNFSIYVFKNDDGVTITGLKDPEDNSVSIFDGTPLVELSFVSKTQGAYDFTVVPDRDKEKTQLVDNKSQVYFPSLNNFSLQVE